MWKAILKNDKKASEGTHKWSEVKHSIIKLKFEYKGFIFNFPQGREYFQFKTASASLLGGEVEIESQTLGVILDSGKKVYLRFNFKSKEVTLGID